MNPYLALPTKPSYTPPAGQENHYRQFLREPLEDTLQHAWNYPGRRVTIYSAYPGDEVHCALACNKIACSPEYKHLRAQFVVTPIIDEQGRPLLQIERIRGKLPPHARVKPGYPILNYLPNPSAILCLGSGHRINYLNFDPRLTPMLKLSLDEWASEKDPGAVYEFVEDRGRQSYSVRVFRRLPAVTRFNSPIQ